MSEDRFNQLLFQDGDRLFQTSDSCRRVDLIFDSVASDF